MGFKDRAKRRDKGGNEQMTNKYRLEQLTEAHQQYANARVRFESAKTKKAKREADEDLQFWGSKLAFLSNPAILG